MTQVLKRPLLHSVVNRAADNLIPFQVSLELTYRCNLSCKHCYVDTPMQDEMSPAEYQSVFKQLAEAGCLYLLFTGGEPLIRPDFFDIASCAKELGFVLMLLTNGTLITPEVARDIDKLEPVSIGVSLHGATPDTHDSITGMHGSFEAMLHGIELLKNLEIPVTFQALLMKSNIHEAEEMKRLAEKLGVFLRFGYEFIPARSGSLAPFQYEADSANLYHHVDLLLSEKNTNTCNILGKKGLCKAGRGICSISPAGDVLPCLLMPLKVGNLRQTKFEEIWRTNPSTELSYLRSITWDDFSDCQDCTLVKYCKRCMGIALAETGELTKPAPSACRRAALKFQSFERKGV